jgi:hypothetical protein
MTPTQFKKLNAEWAKKLKDSGFKDIEGSNGRMDIDKALNNVVTKYDQISYAAKEDYYRMAGHFLHDKEFESDFDRMIWEKHSNGVAITDIVKALIKAGYKAYKRKVHERLQKLVAEMKSHVNKK